MATKNSGVTKAYHPRGFRPRQTVNMLNPAERLNYDLQVSWKYGKKYKPQKPSQVKIQKAPKWRLQGVKK